MPRYITECVGTFFLVLVIALTVTQGVEEAPLAIGAGLAALVYMGGPISGAHYNPAVTLGMWLRGRLGASDILPYVLAQIAGAAAAAGAAAQLTGQAYVPAPGRGVSTMAALGAEILFSFALMVVILSVATSEKSKGNAYYGLSIGLTVTAGAYAVGAISGGVFNPAVGTGPILAATLAGGSTTHLWLYWVGPVAGALLAVPIFRLQDGPGPGVRTPP